MNEVKFFGRIINKNGVSMSKDIQEKVFNCIQLTRFKELKQFIGS